MQSDRKKKPFLVGKSHHSQSTCPAERPWWGCSVGSHLPCPGPGPAGETVVALG